MDESDIQAVLVAMRAGATLQTPGSRCHSTLGWYAGQWYREDFDEGAESRHPASEDEVRAHIGRYPATAIALLQRPLWQRFADAYLAGDANVARRALADWLRHGDRHDAGRVFAALLAWPEQRPTPEVAALIAGKLRDHTAWHLFMDLVGWRRDAETGRAGLAFVEQLEALSGADPDDSAGVRRSFSRLLEAE